MENIINNFELGGFRNPSPSDWTFNNIWLIYIFVIAVTVALVSFSFSSDATKKEKTTIAKVFSFIGFTSIVIAIAFSAITAIGTIIFKYEFENGANTYSVKITNNTDETLNVLQEHYTVTDIDGNKCYIDLSAAEYHEILKLKGLE